MARALGWVLMLVSVSSTALAQEPASAAPVVGRAADTAGSASSTVSTEGASAERASSAADASEERAFSAALESFARRRAFTLRLMAKREAEAFDQALDRQERVAKLQRELTEREAALSEREFDAAVQLYLKKRELTRLLSTHATRPLVR